MAAPTYLDLQRRFTELSVSTDDGIEPAHASFRQVGWDALLKSRVVVLQAPAHYGKTTELREKANRMQADGRDAIFVQLRHVRSQGSLQRALVGRDAEAFRMWSAARAATLTVFLDSLDEASPQDVDELELAISNVAEAVDWPTSDVRWVVSTRPALLTRAVVQSLRSIFFPVAVRPGTASTGDGAAAAGDPAQSKGGEALTVFQLAPLSPAQARRYLEELRGFSQAHALVEAAHRCGLGDLAYYPGGLDMLRAVRLLDDPPENLTEILGRLEQAVWTKLNEDKRIIAAGGRSVDEVKTAVRRLAAASQLCQMPNIEFAQNSMTVGSDALSARVIVGSDIPMAVLQTVLGSHGFIDSDRELHQVKFFPEELAPYLAAQHLSSVASTPDLANKLISAVCWSAESGERGVRRNLLPMLGWLATFNAHCREEILKVDPEALAFFGDLRNDDVPTLDAEKALRGAIERMVRYGLHPGRGALRPTSENFWQAGPLRLHGAIRDLFLEHGKNPVARQALLDIATYARCPALRDAVLSQVASHSELLDQTTEIGYLLELCLPKDATLIAAAFVAADQVPDTIASLVIEKLGWRYLTPRDITKAAIRSKERNESGFQVSMSIVSMLAPVAPDAQLYSLALGLCLAASARRERRGQRSRENHQDSEFYLELASQTLAVLVFRRTVRPRRVALLCVILLRVLRDGQHWDAELDDLKAALAQSPEVRLPYLQLVCGFATACGDDAHSYLYGHGALCPPTETDVTTLGLAALDEAVRLEASFAARAEPVREVPGSAQMQRLEAQRERLLGAAEGIRAGTARNELRWMAQWLVHSAGSSRYGEVQLSPLEKAFGQAMSRAVYDGLIGSWRRRSAPRIASRPDYLDIAGLQGLHLELGDGRALPALTAVEATKAFEFALVELNGLPKWFWPLAKVFPDAATSVVEGALRQKEAQGGEQLWVAVSEAPEPMLSRFTHLLWERVSAADESTSTHVVNRLLSATSSMPEAQSQLEFEQVASTRLTEFGRATSALSASESSSHETKHRHAGIWASHWLQRNPVSFVEWMRRWSSESWDEASKVLHELAVTVGGERSNLLVKVAKSSNDGVHALTLLYPLVERAVARELDSEWPEWRVHPMTRRDAAEAFRESLIPAITEAGTEYAYRALGELGTSFGLTDAFPILYHQHHLREAALSPPPIPQLSFREFESTLFPPVTSQQTFNAAVHNAIQQVKYDIEYGEHSLRRFFGALSYPVPDSENGRLALEKDFQQLLASELAHRAARQFSVVREPETAESNRRDICCMKEVSGLFASIELKMSKGWSCREYLAALEGQLLGQYMRRRSAKAGFLIVVLQNRRNWEDPNSGKQLDFEGLLKKLQHRASELAARHANVYLRVVGIDATEPEKFHER